MKHEAAATQEQEEAWVVVKKVADTVTYKQVTTTDTTWVSDIANATGYDEDTARSIAQRLPFTDTMGRIKQNSVGREPKPTYDYILRES